MSPARKPPTVRKPAPKKAKPRARGGRRRRFPRRVALQRRHLDLIGLGLVAAGVFLAFPLYREWYAGTAGEGMASGLAWLVGEVRFATPVALVAAGALVVLAPVLPTGLRPFRTGALCLFLAVTLGLAAGTLGLGPEGTRHGYWEREFFEVRGGIVGEALYWAASTLLANVGAHILAIFLFIAGALLLTGASVVGVVRATGTGMADTTRALRRTSGRLTPPAVLGRSRLGVRPPEPAEGELVVHAAPAGVAPDPDALPLPDWSEPSAAAEALDDVPTAEGDAVAADPPQLPHDDTVALAPRPDRVPRKRQPEPEPPQEDADFNWVRPGPGLLKRSSPEQAKPDTADQQEVAGRLVEALGHLRIQAKVIGAVAGPHITRYELRLAPGTKMSAVAKLGGDLAYALAATDIRILAPIPGKQAVGVEVPNARRRIVHLGDVFQEPPKDSSPLTVWLGKDVGGHAIAADLAKMPHLLVAGTTGAGKSACVNAMLSSILLRATPHEVRLVLVDPKQVELNHYEAIPHLLTPVITSPRMAANALQNLVREMEWRYGVMSVKRTRSLIELNKVRVGEGDRALPYILCVIDELADLMMVAPADVEDSIIRLAQKARAVGIHLVLATQSPRVDVITGMIKANVPSRIAFAVSSQTDSRVILDQNGAESLLGQGDLLFSPVGSSRLQRIQGAYIDEPQIAALTEFWGHQGEPELREDLLEEVEPRDSGKDGADGDDGFDPDEDPMLGDAIQLVVEMGTASTSMLQRRLRLGYTRAGRLIDMLERRGIISGYEGAKPRQVLVTEADLPRVLTSMSARGDIARPEPAAILRTSAGDLDALA
jgi:DNA segregation ATPase FtsK/SpoIIIE, S-DNA-T family